MSAYGFQDELSMGNHVNEKILARNRDIKFNNSKRLAEHQNVISGAKRDVTNLNTSGEEGKTIGEGVLGQVATKGKVFETAGKIVKSAPKAFGEAVDIGDKYGVGSLDLVSDNLNAGFNKVVTAFPSAFNSGANIGGAKQVFTKTAPSLLKSDAEIFRADPSNLSAFTRMTNKTARGTSVIDDAVDFLKSGKSVGKTIAERAGSIGKLGIASTGLSVGLGLMDTVNDLESHKIEGNNTAERVSNVATQISGGLEAVGMALDMTAVGAPVGVALNILGGVAGLVAGGSELLGEDEEKKSAQDVVKNATNAPVTQQKTQAVVDTASSGAEVKSNY